MRYAYNDGRATGSVYIPGSLGEKKNLPVIVWIHGSLLAPFYLLTSVLSFFLFARGGYVVGNATNGNDLIREAGGGVVAVIIQYRLGVFGFLPGEKVKEGGALNAGLCKCLDCEKTAS